MSGTIWWDLDHPDVLDQTLLPFEERVLHLHSLEAVAEAITSLRVRGAPAIGVTAAFGVAMAALQAVPSPDGFDASVRAACDRLAATRPTAVNLFWAIERMRAVLDATPDPARAAPALLREAQTIAAADAEACRRMGELGAVLFGEGDTLLTHCNAGALATAGIGTALAPMYAAHQQGRRFHVYVDETRPLLQGARLTAWELHRAGIPFTLIADNMAASIIRARKIDAIFVGADRIAANGDVANKIGTYGVALAASAHGVPFYVVAPTSTLDLRTADGDAIPIEERRPEEVRGARGLAWVPDDYPVYNPAFDVTPASHVTAIVTERGVIRPPYPEGLRVALASGVAAR